MKKNLNQSGIIHTLPLLIIIAAVGIISFLLISATAPTNGLFNILNPKPPIRAQAMMGSPFMNNNCGIPNQAFCDTFDQAFLGGGRTGQLNPKKWTVARMSGNNNPGSGATIKFIPSHAMHCKNPIEGVVPDNDYFMCGTEFGESNHFMEAFNDAGSYIYNDARIIQPFDFTGRTGTIIYDVDNKTTGSHGWWTELWITDEPVPAPHFNTFHTPPRNGVALVFSGTCGSTSPDGDAGAPKGNVEKAHVFRNYVGGGDIVTWAASDGVTMNEPGCYNVAPDMLNHMKILINKDHLEVWATDPADQTFSYKLIATFDGLNLQFSRGYVHLQHAQYNASKATSSGLVSHAQTYHWDTVGFDGPVLPAPAVYSVPDALTPAGDPPGSVSVGYNAWETGLQNGPVSFSNVNLTGAKSALITFSVITGTTRGINYKLNNGPWHNFTAPPPSDTGASAPALPVDLAELKNGTNTIDFARVGSDWLPAMIGNIDLILDGAPAPSFTPVPILTPTPVPTPTPTPVPGTITVDDVVMGTGLNQFNYVGAWQHCTSCAPGAYNSSNSWDNTSGDTMTFTFNGQQIAFYGVKDNINGIGAISIDSGAETMVDFFAPNRIGNQLIWTSPILSPGTHTLKLRHTGTKNAGSGNLFIVPDRIDIIPTTTIPTPPSSCPKASMGDINCDGLINIFDYNILISNFGKSGAGIKGDLNGDGVVNIFDYNTLVSNFGK